MMTLTEKAAYLKGLADGLELGKETKEGKLIAALIDLTGELCEAVEVLDADMDEIVEEVLLDEYDDDECDGECDCCELADECELCEDTYEVECPACGEKVCFDEDVDPTELACPACGEKLLEDGEE